MSKQSAQPKRKASKAGGNFRNQPGKTSILSDLWDDCRQKQYPEALQIGLAICPARSPQPSAVPAKEIFQNPEAVRKDKQDGPPISALAEVATCLWYIKTKHFKREWDNEDTTDDDPRTRRTLGRLNKGADSLKKCGLEVADPTGKRYPTGGEAMMRPLDFVPTEGLTYEKVTEVVRPLVYLNGQLIQRAEVFVAVPLAAEVKRDIPVPTEDKPAAPSDQPPAPQCLCAHSPQKLELTINATNDTASAETGEQA